MSLNSDSGSSKEKGTLLIEGMIVMFITVFMLMWILGLGFLYFQRYTAQIIINDAAVKIASTYANPSSDMIMGYIPEEDVAGRDLYRNFDSTSDISDLLSVNESRAQSYIKYKLNKATFSNEVDNVQVKLSFVNDANERNHIVITAKCRFNTPFFDLLSIPGITKKSNFEVTGCADCTDISEYVSSMQFSKMIASGTFVEGTGTIDSIVKLINSIIKTCNSFHS